MQPQKAERGQADRAGPQAGPVEDPLVLVDDRRPGQGQEDLDLALAGEDVVGQAGVGRAQGQELVQPMVQQDQPLGLDGRELVEGQDIGFEARLRRQEQDVRAAQPEAAGARP